MPVSRKRVVVNSPALAAPAAYKASKNTFIEWNIERGCESGFFGNIDTLGPDGASGWIIDAAKSSESIKITLYINNVAVASGIADTYRPDISKIIQVPAHCGFHIRWNKKRVMDAISDLKANQLCPIAIFPEGETLSLVARMPTLVAEVQKWLNIRSINGHLDHVDANLIATGWAINSAQKGSARVEILLDGVVVAEQEANSPRPDFALLKPDHVMSGFKIQIPRKALTRLIGQVGARVDGYLLLGTPIKIDLSNQITIALSMTGHSELRVELSGWLGEALEGELQVDGAKATAVQLTLNPATKKLESCWALPEYLVDGRPHLYVFVIRQGNAVVRSDASVFSYPHYSYCIDQANLNAISGWAFRYDQAVPLRLNLVKAGKRVAQTLANRARTDVAELFPSASAHSGFEFILPYSRDENSAEFKITDTETGITIAEVTVANLYETLSALANSLATSQAVASPALVQAVMSEVVMHSGRESVFSVQTFPRIRPTVRPAEVTVIIPVYGGSTETIECIESVYAARNKTPVRIVIINDCTSDPLIENYLALLESRNLENGLVIHRTSNGGFSQSVNIGMIVAGDCDVILLNADTVVQSHWVDRLLAAADSDARIATVTPLSNNAEICSLPYPNTSSPVPTDRLAVEIDRAAASENAGKTIDIPVAVGFCMYIRRDCLDEIGLFDAATWVRGYGEEVDFCLKAAARGWRNVMTGDTFVVHHGGISFQADKLERIKESAKKITELYPFYDALIQRFRRADPAAPLRRVINLELIDKALPQQRILHITHSFAGGTEQYIKDRIALDSASGYTSIVLRFTETGAAELDIDLTKTRLVGFFNDAHKENYAPDEVDAIKKSIVKLGFERLHIQAPFGIPLQLLDWLSTTYPFNVTIHDYAWICPRVTLTTAGGRYCGEPAVERCKSCIDTHSPHAGLKHFVDACQGDIAHYRTLLGGIILRAETTFAAAEDVVRRMERHGMEGNYLTLPHPVAKGSVFAKSRNLAHKPFNDEVVRVALWGGISDIKGFHLLIDCAENALRKKLPLQFIVFGYTMNDELCRTLSNIEVTGKYDNEALDEVVQRYRPHLSFFPNQWPETFSYTLSHSLRLGIWPIVSDIGAPAERVRSQKFGKVFCLSSSAEAICYMLLDEAFSHSKNRIEH